MHWRSRPILVIPFHTPRLPPDLGGLPSIMELLAITGGLEVLANLGLTARASSGKFFTHMFSGATQLGPDIPSSDAASARYNTTPSNYVERAATHNEETSPPNCWDQHQWGIFLADCFGGPQPSTLRPQPRLPHATPLLPDLPPNNSRKRHQTAGLDLVSNGTRTLVGQPHPGSPPHHPPHLHRSP